MKLVMSDCSNKAATSAADASRAAARRRALQADFVGGLPAAGKGQGGRRGPVAPAIMDDGCEICAQGEKGVLRNGKKGL